MEKFLNKDSKSAHAGAIPIILMITAVSSVFYISKGFFNFRLWLMASSGGILGGILGARLLGKIPKAYLKMLFGGIIIFTAIKMIK